jgi:membrane fusion protein, adhesin transport system
MRIFTFPRVAASGLVLFLAWAYWFELDQTVKTQGQLIPETRTQVIQAADGGVLEKLLVEEGDVVKGGQVLAILESQRANAGLEEGRAKVASLLAALARAQAEGAGRIPQFDPMLRQYPVFLQEQTRLFQQKQKMLNTDLSTLQEALELAKGEYEINEKLFRSGDTSLLELMRAKRQVSEVNGRIESTRQKFRQDAQLEATKIQEELASQRFKVDERLSVLDHTQLVSPVDGVVKVLRVNTVGGVLRAGDELMQISPTNVSLMAEIKISPSDIGQLRVGLPVGVKVDAFDYAIYGQLTGQLEYISSDTLTEQAASGQAPVYYRARVRIDLKQDNLKIPLVLLKPGMTVAADVRTGSRSILTYLLKPIIKAFHGAATER